MPLSIIIDAPIEKVYEVLDTPALNSVWNPVIEKITETSAGSGKCHVDSFMGTFDTTKTAVPNRSVTLNITTDSTILQQLKYELEDLSGTQTRVNATVQLTAHYSALHKSVGIELLHNLKRYIEYIKTAGATNATFKKVMKD